MGLFINKNEHPDVYKNIKNITAPNQSYIRHNPLTELLNEQQKVNINLEKSIAELKPIYEQLEEKQATQWNQIRHQLNALNASSRYHEEIENMIIDRLNTLDKNEKMLKQSIFDQMNSLNEAYQQLLKRLEKNEASYEDLSMLMNKQLDLQKEVAQSLSKQEEFHAGVLKRLDTQEALTEKISRQLGNIRSALFERTNYIATKLEDSYKLTSEYIFNLMTGSDKPTYSTKMNFKKKQTKKQSD